jgi:cytochrome c553
MARKLTTCFLTSISLCVCVWAPILFAAENSLTKKKQSDGPTSPLQSMVQQYCADCHDRDMKKGGLDLDSIYQENVTQHPDVWEKVVRKLRTRQMPQI